MELTSYTSIDDAIKKGMRQKPNIALRKVPVLDAVGRYSMEDVKSPEDYPKYNRSAMDGYAVDSRETISATRINPATFTVVGELFPSSTVVKKVTKGQAMKVTTGSRIPIGADAVAMLEEASEDGKVVSVFTSVRKYQNVSLQGEDMKRGFPILRKGQLVTPPHVVALLESGVKEVKVCSLSIGILSTGDEIVSGQVTNSTQPFLQSIFERRGFRTRSYGAVEDDEHGIEKILNKMKEDLIIVTGGTGPGEKDLLPLVIKDNGKFVFRGLRIRPGRTTSFGVYRGKPIFMISGLPVAALIASENVILQLIYGWFGLEADKKEYREGTLQRSVVNTLGFRSFVRVKMQTDAGATKVIPTRITGSGVIYSVIDADGIIVIDENSEGVEEGQLVRVEMLRW